MQNFPRNAKNDQEIGRAKFFLKTLLLAFMDFMIINIERFGGINFVIGVTKT